MTIRQRSRRARRSRGLAEQLGLGVMETAQGILSVVTANMARAIRVISVQRGHDPRDYTLMAFGGAGPLHAARLARELEIGRVLVPRNPGILCAMGLLLTDLRADFARDAADARDRGLDGRRRRAPSPRWRERAERWFEHEGIAPADAAPHPHRRHALRTARTTSCVAVPDGPITPATLQALAAGFADAHRQRYGFVADGEPVQLVTFRVEATGAGAQGRAHGASRCRAGCVGAPSSATATVWLPEARRLRRHARSTTATRCSPGNRFAGPAIVEQMDATTLSCPA